MSTPVATIADALIAFIMSLLRDPAAVQEFTAAPQAVMAKSGVANACLADVKAVKPVIVDHPSVEPKPPTPPAPVEPSHHVNPPVTPANDVINEITRIINQFTTIDARSTLVDQSVNQNIWTNGGDVTQIFDQSSVVASGDHAVAAGHDASVVNSTTDVSIGDVAIGNTTNDGSFNTNGDGPVAPASDAPATPATDADPTDLGAAVGSAVGAAVDGSVAADSHTVDTTDTAASTGGDLGDGAATAGGDAAEPAHVAVDDTTADAPAPSAAATVPVDDPLGDDMGSAGSYGGEDHAAVVDDAYIEEPVDDQ